ncbi:MAG: 3-dehydroquinate dehydratase [Bacteroidales bacterium]|nr:3-dehydroquinate dehydratase [Bacteroidales bacterium]
MKIIIINGPNLNLLGSREPEWYGRVPFETYFRRLQAAYPEHRLSLLQTNEEGALVSALQQAAQDCDAVILNAAAFSHTSVAIADAVRAIPIPVIEVHLSPVFAREGFRHHSFTAAACKGTIAGFGLDGYRLAVEHLTGNAL